MTRRTAASWRRAVVILGLSSGALGISGAPGTAATLRVAVYTDFVPFSNRERVGLDVDLANRIAADLGRTADITAWNSDESLDDDLRYILWGGRRADLMMHVPYDPRYGSRIPQVALLGPYYREREVLAYAPGRLPATTSLETLTTHKVGVMLATGADSYLMSALDGRLQENVRHFLRPSQAAAAMKAGEIDGIMGEAVELEAALEDAGVDYRMADPPGQGPALNAWDVGVAVRSEDTALAKAVGAAIGRLRQEGIVARLFDQRRVTYTPPRDQVR